MVNDVNIFTIFESLHSLKRHKNFTNNLPKQNQSSGENGQVTGLVIRKGKLGIIQTLRNAVVGENLALLPPPL